MNHENLNPNDDSIEHLPLDQNDMASILNYAHERFGVDLDASQITAQTLAKHGFTPVEPSPTPSVNEWIAERILNQGYAGYNHGSFVANQANQLGFAKVHYGPDNTVSQTDKDGETVTTTLGGPKREAEVLQALADLGVEVPAVLGYFPESTESNRKYYETLVIEAYSPDIGAVRKRQDWTPHLAQLSAKKLADFARPSESVPLFADESIPQPLRIEELIIKLPRLDDNYRQTIGDVVMNYNHVDEPVTTHGDVWFNNIIARHDDSDLMFVDWELAGPGYRGQDAGRKLWDLTLNDDWQFDEYGPTAEAFTQAWSQTPDDRQSLTFGVAYESLRWISDRIDMIDNPETDEATRISLVQEIEVVKQHTLMVLANVNQG